MTARRRLHRFLAATVERGPDLIVQVDAVCHQNYSRIDDALFERNRLRHSALLAVGVLRAYWSLGVASRMLGEVIAWAPGAGIKRLELTVHTANARAVGVYQRCGFEIEGIRRSSMLVDGVYTDEYLMALITGI